MARTLFDCIGLNGSGITPYTTLDSRSGVGLINNGQMAFFGSSNDSGPLGVVFQHVCGNGYCRVEITSTRYGISGNDLSLNVDSGNPDTGGGMTIKYRGNVGIGTGAPNIVGFSGNVLTINGTGNYQGLEIATSATSRMTIVSDGLNGYVSTRQAGMCIIFEAGAASEKMRITSAGNVGIGTGTPDAKLHICNAVAGNTDNFLIIVQNCCTVSGARAGIAFSNNSQTPSAGGLSGASIQASNNGIDGTGNLLFGTLASGTNTERMRITYDGKVGIGATSPGGKMHISHTGAEGACVLIFQSTNSCGNGTIAWRSSAGTTQAQIGSNYNVADSAGNLEFITTASTRLLITSAGCVGVGTASPTYKLHVNGTFYAAGSSQDYKQSICNYNTDSCMFMKLKPVTYQYKEEYCHLGKELKSGTQIGLIAEEVAETYPELAILVNEEANKVVRNVDYEKLSVILLSEVQKLRREVDDLKHKQ